MHQLTNEALTVAILDPVADRDRMGPRYCTGGYIFQVSDADGPLLSGPTYPESFNWFDGQGIPDSFAGAALRDPDAPSARALIPGIGICDTVRRTVLEHCEWDVSREPPGITFATTHEFAGFAMAVERTVGLAGRVITCTTRVRNTGTPQLPIRWFPHPFFPIPDGPALCQLPGQVSLPPETTYSLGADGYLRCEDLAALQAVAVRCAPGAPLTVLQRHPRLGLVAARFSFAPRHVLVWGNPNTFSFEPYLDETVGTGTEISWEVSYHF